MIRIDKITIAVDDIMAMKDFYSGTFQIEFTSVELFGNTLYQGAKDGLTILLCPKTLAGVEADINTIQPRFVVKDVAATFRQAVASGGKSLTEIQEYDGELVAAVRDPDNNSLEFVQDK